METEFTDEQVEAKGKQMGLRWINDNRAKMNIDPATRVEKLWWELHGEEWRSKARIELKKAL